MAGGIEENSVSATTTTGVPFVVIALLRLEFLDLLRRDADRAVDGNTGAGEQSGQQVTLITLNIGKEASRFDGTAALPRNHEGEVFASVLIAILEPRSPHHDAVVQQRAVS